jgi:hypothetical protein
LGRDSALLRSCFALQVGKDGFKPLDFFLQYQVKFLRPIRQVVLCERFEGQRSAGNPFCCHVLRHDSQEVGRARGSEKVSRGQRTLNAFQQGRACRFKDAGKVGQESTVAANRCEVSTRKSSEPQILR